jgi:RP/EB family microtubule-associated protein
VLITLTSPRQELLAWLNNLLQLNFTKIEQCGTGCVGPKARCKANGSSAAYCQIFDSIFSASPPATSTTNNGQWMSP